MEPRVVGENEWVIAINKPAGLIVHSDGRTEELSLVDWILAHHPELIGVGEEWRSPQGNLYPRPGLVHRLDRTTSGIMLLAKTQDAYLYFKKEFKERRVEKMYRAMVYGHMEADAGKIVAEICRSSEPPKHWYAESCEEENPRAAITDWRVLSRGVDPTSGEKYTTLSITSKTGRTHQIRVHMAFIGHPLIADHLYGASHLPILGFTRPALHAESISIAMPSGERVTFVAPTPHEFLI